MKSLQRKCNIAEQRLGSLETIANETKLIELKGLNEKLNDTFESEKRQIERDHEQVLSTMRMEKEKLNLAIVHHEASEKHALASYSILKMCSTEKWEPSIGIQSHESHIQAMKAMYNILLKKEEQLFQVYSNAQNNESKTSIKQDSYYSAYQNPEGKLKVASNSGVNSTKNKILVDPALDQITLMREIEDLKVQLSDYATQETNLTFALQANSKSFHRHFGDEIFQRWYVNNISRLMKDFSIDSQKQAQIMDKLKESLIAYTHKNKITVNAYIEDEEKKIEEAVKEKIIALDKNKEALLEKDKQITSLKREKEELRSSLKTELEKAHKTKLEHEDEIRSLKEDEIRSLKEDETKVNEMVMESKSSDTDQIEKLQNTLSDKEAAIHELTEDVNTLRSKLNASSSFIDNYNVVKTPVPHLRRCQERVKDIRKPWDHYSLKSMLSAMSLITIIYRLP